MKILKLTSIFLLLGIRLFAQGSSSAGTDANFATPYLIDMPTAGILDKGLVGVEVNLLPEGVLVSRIQVGVFKNFSFGISYGAGNFIGSGEPNWYKLPGICLRARISEEDERNPAITLGFDSQGKGNYFSRTELGDIDRYKIKSPGFFASISKNFALLGYLSLHGTANYSLERNDGDRDIDLQVGAEKTIGSSISLLAEYDFAINDNSKRSLGDGSGYFNIGVRWSLGNGLTLGVDLKDLLSNKKVQTGAADRALKVEFIKPIF